MIRKLIATIEILRPHNMLAAAACVTSGYVLAGGDSVAAVAPAAVLTGFVTGFGNLINDFYDRDIDRINKPRRPIPSGRLSADLVRVIYVAGSVATLAATIVALDGATRTLVLAWQALLYLYARYGKRLLLGGGALVAAIAGSAFVCGALVAGRPAAAAWPGSIAFLLVLGRELLKGAEDVEGDRVASAATPAIRWGVGRAVALGVAMLLLCVVAVPAPALMERYGRLYLMAMEILFVPGVMGAAALALRRPDPATLARASSILKVQMFLGIVSLVSARF